MIFTYLDTSAVMDWLELGSSAPDVKAASCGPKVEALLRDSNRSCAVSELTLIETFNAIHTAWRNPEPRKSGYDEEWARAAQAQLLEAVADGTLTVRPAGAGDLEHALMLVTEMTSAGRKFKAWDAVHLRMAVQWSRESGQTVELVTSNGDFQAFLDSHTYFARHVTLVAIS